jgi:16S rRNA processing protein RimM
MAVGRIAGAHGIRGEVKVESLTDYPERFRSGSRLYLGSEHEARPVQVTGSRPHQSFMLLKLDVTPDRSAAEQLVGQYLLIAEEDAMPLGEHENYAHDLLGLNVETPAGRVLGKLTDILSTGANDVYIATGPDGKEILIPALRQVVLTVDLPGQRMVVELPEGLEDLQDGGKDAPPGPASPESSTSQNA